MKSRVMIARLSYLPKVDAVKIKVRFSNRESVQCSD